MQTKIGIFSGTFDPVHIGHVEACLVAKEACNLDKIFLLVEGKPRRKTGLSSVKDRREMINIATKDFPSINLADLYLDNVTAQKCLEFLKKTDETGDYWYILGSDILSHISSWPELDILLNNFNLCAVLRSNQEEDQAKKKLEELLSNRPTKYKILPAVYSEVSSTIAKNDLGNHKKYLDAGVAKYIKDKGLYSRASSK